MRPVQLDLHGFGAFRDPVTIDFRAVDFFALVGATGAGKSTVLDAICFALYGNVPRYDDQRLVAAAMSLGANEARVRLEFEVGGVGYVAVRVVRRGAQNKVSTKEARLERTTGEILAGRESEFRGAVESVVGLSFEDFTRCVVLPQGAFARFLHDKPADRQALLVRLLDLGVYARLMQRATARATERQRVLDHLGGELSGLGPDDPEAVERLREQLGGLGRLSDRLDEAAPRLAEHRAELQRLEATGAEALGHLAALDRIGAPSWLADHARELDRAMTELAHAEAAAAEAARTLAAAQQAAAEQPAPGELERVLGVFDRVTKGRLVVLERERALESARERAAGSSADVLAASAAVDAARAELRTVEHAHLAHSVALTLVPGEPCPVCEHPVDRLPLAVAPPALADAASRLRVAEAERDRVAAAAAQARDEFARAEAQLRAGAALLAELELEIGGYPDEARTRVMLAEAERRAEVLAAAQRDARLALGALDTVRPAVERSRARVAAVGADFHGQRDAVAALGPPPPGAELAPAWAELEAWAARTRPGVEQEAARAAEAGERVRQASSALLGTLATEAGGLGIELSGAAGEDRIRSEVTRAAAGAEHRLAAATSAAARRIELEASRNAAEEERSVATELARQLRTDRFQRWLVESAFHELAERASELLLRLSNGQFSLRVNPNGEFTVVDHLAADEERSVRTLSGGETFQASLALALALSEHVVELGGERGQRALESIFLDEGFGTLDPESLDIVASTIESLGTDGRMVGIVTHVRDLAERVPIRFRVTKGPRTSTIEREEG